MIKAFGYYKTLLKQVRDKKQFTIERINEVGGRMSSKTFSGLEFAILCCLLAKTKVYAFRYWQRTDIRELHNQFLAIISTYPGLIDKLKVKSSPFQISFPNGSIIEIKGLHQTQNDDVKLTGLSGGVGFDYCIAIAEERYEISDAEWAAVQQAIRGFDNYLELHLANPWIMTNDFITYCNKAMPFNLDSLKTDYQQFKVIDKEIFHYTNYNINEFLLPADRKKLINAAKHDPHRENTILYGFPGSPKGAVWTYALPKMLREHNDASIKFVGCVDYGERGDASTGYIIGFDASNSHAHVQHEYYWANAPHKQHKDTNVLATETFNHFAKFFDDTGMTQVLDVFVDNAAIPFITALNNMSDMAGYGSVIKFWQCHKEKVAYRTEQIKLMGSLGMLTVDKGCAELIREYSEQTYSDKASKFIEGDDHGTDAVAYGLAHKWVELMDNMEFLLENNEEA